MDSCVSVSLQHCSCSVTVTDTTTRHVLSRLSLIISLLTYFLEGALWAVSYLSLNPRPVVDLCKLVGVCMCGLSSHGSNTCRLSNWLRFALDYNCEWLSVLCDMLRRFLTPTQALQWFLLRRQMLNITLIRNRMSCKSVVMAISTHECIFFFR